MMLDSNLRRNLFKLGTLKDISNLDSYLESVSQSFDSVGGIIEVRVNKIPVGLGEPFFDSVESKISHILFSIPAVKGVEFGVGFKGIVYMGHRLMI